MCSLLAVSPPGTSTEESRAIIREMIRHEDKLRTERLGWLLTLNGFLFAALGFAWGAKEASRLVFVLAILGVVVGLSALAAMNISGQAVRQLRNWSDELPGKAWAAPVMGTRSADLPLWARILVPWRVLPWALVVAWPLLYVLRRW
jgi:hypothetical protein